MNRLHHVCGLALLFALATLFAFSAEAQAKTQDNSPGVPKDKVTALQSSLDEAGKSRSSARRKLALRRVVREGEALLEQYKTAPNRFEVLGVLFKTQRELVGLDSSDRNRAAFLQTCKQLAAAPKKYAAIRLEADLLLSQTELARKGASTRQRAEALRPLVERYLDTEVQSKVIRIAMLMALEYGDSRVINHLREVIAEHCAADLDMIAFQRAKLKGQVFGAPFVGSFKSADGKTVRFPMDGIGQTVALYFWSKDDGGLDNLKALGEAWLKVKDKAAGRFRFVSFNLDGLPDAGQSILRELGLDWQALHLPDGRKNPVYQTYAQNDPSIVTVSSTGYAALFMSGGLRSNRTYDRRFQSYLARTWTEPRYCSQLQSVFAGEYFVLDNQGPFDPASPPELKALSPNGSSKSPSLKRTADSMPKDKLQAIQACFIKPPDRYRTPWDQVKAGYEKADALCKKAIEEHPKAPDLWLVRNRRIVALVGLWKLTAQQKYFAAAVDEAKAAVEGNAPAGADLIARFCLARQAVREAKDDPQSVITGFVDKANASGPALVAGALLALEIADRQLHERYRRALLDKHTDHPMLWTPVAFMLDRYHRYWLYRVPFVAGWTYGRRQSYYIGWGKMEDANRSFKTELKTLDGGTLRIPEDTKGKWTVISFVPKAESTSLARGANEFAAARPFEDVQLFTAVLDEDAEAASAALKAMKRPREHPTVLVPDGMTNPLVQKLGIIDEDTRENVLILRPDGTIAIALSGMTMRRTHSSTVMQNVIQYQDEKDIEKAIKTGDLETAKRLVFAFAPVQEPEPVDPKKKKKKVRKKAIPLPHLRARAKYYMAVKDWKAALVDAEEVYLSAKQKAGHLSKRTIDLDEAEKIKETILKALEKNKPGS